MPDFWQNCGYRYLRKGEGSALHVSDDFIRSLLIRPELAPIAESCAAERALHDRLMASPQSAVPQSDLKALADPDAADNYAVFLRFRDRLLQAPTLQAAYRGLFGGDGVNVPPMFVYQLAQIFLRHILGEAADPLQARMAECLFRPQKVTVMDDGSVMAADEETVERWATGDTFGSLGELLRKQQTPLRSVDLDVLSTDNASDYWSRDERFDCAVSLNRGQASLDALCRVLEAWVLHFTGRIVSIKHQREIDDKRWVWHVGLDAQASSILNALYNKQEVDEAAMKRLLCLFELHFADPNDMRQSIAGRPVYLAMAMDEKNRLLLKPQNLLLNLPLREAQ